MSKIRFEWSIESQQIDRSDGKDPSLKKRRRNALRFLILIVLLLATMGLGAIAVRQRLIDVQNHYAQLLQDTVKAEVAALRIGDLDAWLNFQSAGSEEWRSSQTALFREYEALKSAGAIELTGSIVAVKIDDTRARVLVQENINGTPYVRLWFYRRDQLGWRHIAPDIAFWGEERQYTGAGVRVNYRAVDETFAQQLIEVVTGWRTRSCSLMNCGALPILQVDIAPNAPDAAAWIDESNLHLRLRSPYVDLARADLPFDGAYRLQVSKLLADRLVMDMSGFRAIYSHDAFFLQESALNWLSEWLVGVVADASLMHSLAQNYGEQAVAELLSVLKPTDDMSILQEALPVAIETAGLDWRDFIAWRLNTEAELIRARAENEWLRLYDTSDENVRLAAYQRFNDNVPPRAQRVIDQAIWTTNEDIIQLRATAEYESGSATAVEIVLFNLVNQVWKRAS